MDIKIDSRKIKKGDTFIALRGINKDGQDYIEDAIKRGATNIICERGKYSVNTTIVKDTKEYLTVIDLDTVMPGSSLYDYGDGVRSCASNALEDEKDLDKVFLNTQLFESYTNGYLDEMAPYLTEAEVCNMGEAIKIITFELGLRFLNDYINGDTYFKTDYELHNLYRARNQFKLLLDIKDKMPYINEYILNKYKEKVKKI